AMGLTSLDSLEDFRMHNAANFQAYRGSLAGIPGIRLIEFDERERNNFQYVVIEVDETVTGIDRDTLVALLHAENVRARRYFYPGCHRMAPYRDGIRLPNTEALAARTITLPTGTSVGAGQIAQICQLVRRAVAGAADGTTPSTVDYAVPVT
ncbi:MAG: DegT/DnrJ/EryC1/StrS family aminotransferase, partial [Micromonosporaceae bacterium]|nr:DegT/DnrJ/EryC1/StrS family aminotransferase [Micromonosporaceae bacterium]